MVFGLFKKKLSPAELARQDIETSMQTAFDVLAEEAKNPDQLHRLFAANARFAALIGALRDTYPGLPVDDHGPAMTLIEMIGTGDVFEAERLANALCDLIRYCPNQKQAKLNVMIFSISPSSVPIGERPREGPLAQWATAR